LRDGIFPTITHLRPDKLLRKEAFQKGFASHSRNRLKNKHPDFTFPLALRVPETKPFEIESVEG
jgi:hypothetical protein